MKSLWITAAIFTFSFAAHATDIVYQCSKIAVDYRGEAVPVTAKMEVKVSSLQLEDAPAPGSEVKVNVEISGLEISDNKDIENSVDEVIVIKDVTLSHDTGMVNAGLNLTYDAGNDTEADIITSFMIASQSSPYPSYVTFQYSSALPKFEALTDCVLKP